MSRMLSVRLDEGLYDTLVEQAEADGRSLSNYVTRLLAEAQRLQEGHSTLGSSPTVKPRPVPPTATSGSMRSKATKRAVPRDTAHDRLEAQKILDRVLKAPKPRTAEPAQDGEDGDEDDGEYFKRIQRENAQKAKGVGPEEWPS